MPALSADLPRAFLGSLGALTRSLSPCLWWLGMFLLTISVDAFAVRVSGTPLSMAAARLVEWTQSSADHGGRPYLVVDKRTAQLHVFQADGTLLGSAPVLLGAARGDHTVPGIGERPLALVRPHERTTPAGRFEGEMGRNLGGEDVLWVDYDAAVSIHRVRANVGSERRLQRLASQTSRDNRISFGCINVPADFFDRVLLPAIGDRTVIYVLPDTLPLEEVFPLIRAESIESATAQSSASPTGREVGTRTPSTRSLITSSRETVSR